jgi:hypothetical protein
MHLLLDLGQLCAGKISSHPSPAYTITAPSSGKQEARVSCVAVHQGKKLQVVLRMEPLVLRSYEAVHGQVRSGDPLEINVCEPVKIEIYKRDYAPDGTYFLITTNTLSRAPMPGAAKEQKADIAGMQHAQSAMN